MAVVVPALILIPAALGAGLGGLSGDEWKRKTGGQRALVLSTLMLAVVAFVGSVWWSLWDGPDVIMPPNAAQLAERAVPALNAPDPPQNGSYDVAMLTYGSGTNIRRSEYGAAVDVVTGAVDGSRLLPEWTDRRAQWWGFGPDVLPINARVWYPNAPGPFPLVLMVHGNADMEKPSDSGYAYLGELLASRGFFFASVDENFLNSSNDGWDKYWGDNDFAARENDARGWLLLEHLRFWRRWSTDPASPFHGKVDMERIAVMGHSRGGEAAVVAAVLNGLSHYPDDAELAFDYGFGIRTVVSIAPDNRYKPAGLEKFLKDVNFLTLQGAHDMDVISFTGQHQYERAELSQDGFMFKAAVYIYGANHGQFNTVWGRDDVGAPGNVLYNFRQLMSAEDQQQVAKLFLSALLEATLREDRRYVALFRDVRVGSQWLPETIYLARYQGSADRLVATYEEDVDPATGTQPGVVLAGEGFKRWREHLVVIRCGLFPLGSLFGTMGNNAAYLAWERQPGDPSPVYSIELPDRPSQLDQDGVLTFQLADGRGSMADHLGEETEWENRDPIDLSVEVADRRGQTASVSLGQVAYLQPEIESHLLKARWMRFLVPTSEAFLSGFEIPLEAFAEANPALLISQLSAVRFVFDRTPEGAVLLDNAGFRKASQIRGEKGSGR
jgi:dienelactone hydrolase